MTNVLRQFAKALLTVPALPAEVRTIHSDLIHAMPAVELFGLGDIGFLRSDLIHSMPAVELFGVQALPFIHSNLTHSLGAAGINSVQYGSISTSFSGTTASATINAVDVNKSLLFYLGFWGNPDAPSNGYFRLELTNSTTVTMTRYGSSSYIGELYFTVVEWNCAIAQMQRGTIDITAGLAQADKTITAVNLAKTILAWCSCQAQETQTTELFKWLGTITLTSNTNLRALRRGTTLITRVGYNLIEFS